MKEKIVLFLTTIFVISLAVTAQNDGKSRLQVNGFIQTEMEILQYEGKSNNGAVQTYDTKRDGSDNDYFIRYGVRRGGIRLAYNQGIATGVFELDLNDGGLYPKAAMIQIKPYEWIQIDAGLQTVWFGEEVPYSTPKQEVLEHCELLRNLFFLDRDLGLKVSLIAPQKWDIGKLRLDVGFVNGNNINKIQDGKLSFVGHLKYSTYVKDVYFGLGTSVFEGKVHNMYNELTNAGDSPDVPTAYDGIFSTKEDLKRTYFGIDAQLKFHTSYSGTTELKGEYIWGQHPSQLNSFRSPNNNEYSNNISDAFCMARKFNGGYIYVFQDIRNLPIRILLKYTFMNPNTELSSEEKAYATDVKYQTFGIGCAWNIAKGLRLTGIYNVNLNEKCNNLPSYSYDRKDNHFTMRLQYEF